MEPDDRFPSSYRRRDLHGRDPLPFRTLPTVVVSEPEEDIEAREAIEREARQEQLRRDREEFQRLRALSWGVYLPPSSWDRRDSGCSACISDWNDDAEREERERIEAAASDSPTPLELEEAEQREADLRARWRELSILARTGEGVREPLRGHGQGEDGASAGDEVTGNHEDRQPGPEGDWQNPVQPEEQ